MILTWLRGKKFYIKMSFMSITSNDTELLDNESNNIIISFNKWSYESEDGNILKKLYGKKNEKQPNVQY